MIAVEEDEVARFDFRLGKKLKDKIDESIPPRETRNRFLAQLIADALGCPELGEVPIISIGRPRKSNGNGR